MNRVFVGFTRNVNFLYTAERNILTATVPMPTDIPWRIKSAVYQNGDMLITFEPLNDPPSGSAPPPQSSPARESPAIRPR